MQQVKLNSKETDGHIYVQVDRKGNLIKNKQGFVPVKNSPMWVDIMNVDYIEKWYKIPKTVKL